MTARHRGNGWAGLVDDESIDGERPAEAPQAPQAPLDPVIAAMREVEGDPPAPMPSRPPPRARARPAAERGAVPSARAIPGADTQPGGRPASMPAAEPAIRLPLPDQGGGGASLTLPTPDAGPTPRPTSTPEPAAPGFSPDALLEHLDGPTAPAKKPINLREYRELIITGAVCALGVAGYLGYQSIQPAVAPPAPPPVVPNMALEKIEAAGRKNAERAAGTIKRENAVPQTKAAVIAPTPKPKATLPMLSVLSEPLGAMVEINGKLYGKTPLIRPSPFKEGEPISIRLKMQKYRAWVDTVTPNEAGHYVAKATLRPR